MKAFFTTVLYQPLFNLLIFFVALSPSHSIGFAIIILTLIIRAALLPLSLKGARAQVKMQALQPKINRMRKEIKDQQEQSKALMELYKKEGVSPFGSCLIALVQLPILIVLYRVFRAGLGSDMTMLYPFMHKLDFMQTHFLGIDLAHPDKFILPILAAGTQFILSYMMMPPQKAVSSDEKPDPMVAMNKQMMFMFPLMTLIFARSMPAALSLYWIVTTLFSIAQQLYININIKKELEIVGEEIEELDLKIGRPVEEVVEAEFEEAPKKKDLMTQMVDKRLSKQEKKTGVEITIRKKK